MGLDIHGTGATDAARKVPVAGDDRNTNAPGFHVVVAETLEIAERYQEGCRLVGPLNCGRRDRAKELKVFPDQLFVRTLAEHTLESRLIYCQQKPDLSAGLTTALQFPGYFLQAPEILVKSHSTDKQEACRRACRGRGWSTLGDISRNSWGKDADLARRNPGVRGKTAGHYLGLGKDQVCLAQASNTHLVPEPVPETVRLAQVPPEGTLGVADDWVCNSNDALDAARMRQPGAEERKDHVYGMIFQQVRQAERLEP